jgi:hypothetical protein
MRRSCTGAWPWGRSPSVIWGGSTWRGASGRSSNTSRSRARGSRTWKTSFAKWAASGKRPDRAGTSAGTSQRQISAEEIVEREVYGLVNEGARILEEGYALRAGDIDIIYLNGYGFPGFRGGPMWYADTIGVKKVYDRICEFHKQHGMLWEPAPLLKKLAETGGKFADYERSAAQATD